jgi:hypothetical protein
MEVLEVIKPWGKSEKIPDVKSIVESLNRFISFIKKANREENLASLKDKKIDFIPLFEQESYNQQESIWNIFLNKLQNNININNNSSELFKKTNAILFYTPEEIPRGDFPDSVYNKSRMLRNFFENTSLAKTANYRNIVEKLKELIIEIENKDKSEGKKEDLTDAINKDLKSLLSTLENNIANSAPSKPLLEDLSEIYTYRSFHTKEAHGNLRRFKEFLEGERNDLKVIEDFKNDYYLERQKHDIASIISVNPLRFTSLEILVIDDNKYIADDLKKVKKFLPEGTKIFLTDEKEYKKFINDPNFIKRLYGSLENGGNDEKTTLKMEEVDKINENSNFTGKPISEKGKFIFHYIIVDLLLGNYNEGNKIIRQLVKLRDYLGYEKASFSSLPFP